MSCTPESPSRQGRDEVDSLRTRDAVMLAGRRWQLHRFDRLGVDHLPFTFKVLLENLLRHEDGQLVTAEQIDAVRRWHPSADRHDEVDLHPTRVFLHDTNGVPALVDLAAMRDAVVRSSGSRVQNAQRTFPVLAVKANGPGE
jgi:aconitate hydratase